MIDSKELRLGNWVKVGLVYTDELSQNEQPEYRFRQVDKKDFYKTDFFMPIPLTPGILIACGFSHQVEDDVSYYIQNDLWFAHTSDDWYLSFHVEGKPFQFLHQLQNLYFALTGTELVFSDVLKIVK